MPPRKSNVSAVSATGDEGSSLQTGKESTGSTNIEDLSLPRTVVGRLAKGVLPANTIIQKDAIMAITKASTLFVNYLSHNSHAHTLRTTRRTIYPADVFMGLRDSEFDFMLPRLEAELDKYNSVQTSKRNEYRKKVKEGTMGNPSRRKSTGDAATTDAQMSGVEDEEPTAKRAKMEEGVARGHRLGLDGMEEEDGDETVEEEEVGEEAGDDAGEGEEDEEGDEDEEEGAEDEEEDESREVGEDDDDTLAEESD